MAKDFDNRVETVKLMHETMLCMNNENAYMTMNVDKMDRCSDSITRNRQFLGMLKEIRDSIKEEE